ncbi:putative HNHc nuclease [Enterococcus sp. GC40]|uniref:putative HNHc nuclease n=1 Tax=Enterococcus sp. GC40 TaxID=3231359 RepID=UPI0034A022D3
MANLLYLAKVKSIDGREMKIELAEDLNIERLQTVYHGHVGARYCELRFLDPRSFSVDQRKYYYALLGDISAFTGHLIEEVDDNTRWKFKALTGRNISLSNGSSNTKDDVVLLTNIALDLAFELNVSLSNKIPIPDKNLEYYFYKCLTHRKCCICGKHADIDHFDETVGMGNNRDKVDKTKYTYCALCRSHHTEKHTIGLVAFRNKYHVYGITLSAETIERLNI